MGVQLETSGGKKKGPSPDINVTPLVDVVLVLLIIFMIITPQLDNKVPVELQAIQNPDEGPKPKIDPLEITVAKDGKFYIEQDELTESDMQDLLKSSHAAEPKQKLVIRADKETGFAAARVIFKAAKEVGYPGVSLMVGKPGSNGEEQGADKES